MRSAHIDKGKDLRPKSPVALLVLAAIQRAVEDAEGNIGRAIRSDDPVAIPTEARRFFGSALFVHWVDLLSEIVPPAERLRDLADVDWCKE